MSENTNDAWLFALFVIAGIGGTVAAIWWPVLGAAAVGFSTGICATRNFQYLIIAGS